MTLPISFNEFRKNPIAAVTFCMLLVVGYLYYDSEKTKQEILKKCENDNEKLSNKIDHLEKALKTSDSLLVSCMYANKVYLNYIEADNEKSK